MEIKEGTSVEAHIKTMNELTNRLAAINVPIAEEDQIVTLLGNLPSTNSTLVTTLEARDTTTLSYTQQAILCEEHRLMGESKTSGNATSGDSTGRALTEK